MSAATRRGTRPERARRMPLGLVLGTALVTGAVLVAPAAAVTVPAAPGLAGPTTLLSVSDPAGLPAATAAVEALGGRVVASYDVAGALLASLPTGSATPAGTVVVPDVTFTFAAAGSADGVADVPGATYRDTVGASDAATGAGVTVALVDTGVADVPDLAGRVEHLNVSGGPQGDGYGHGTFLAGLVAGSGAQSDGAYRGVAPGAGILDVQVATQDGATSMAQVLAGLQAVADRAAVDPSLDVLLLALSTGSPLPPTVDPLGRALDTLWRRGVTVVVAAGNDGPKANSVSSPGSDPLLLTVGAVDEARTSARADDAVADFSARSRRYGVDKPELVAPGVSLISLRAPGSIADVENEQARVGEAYFRGTGTSMSTAVAAGASAVLLSERPTLTPTGVKAVLSRSAYPVAGDGAGAGGLDLRAALDTPMSPTVTVPGTRGDLGPDESDATAWAAFAAAWAAGDLEGVRAAWSMLSPQSRRWAATAWSTAVIGSAIGMPAEEFAEIAAQSRRWATEAWNSRRWAEDAWVSRRWASDEWASRRWALADWVSRRWAGEDWSSRRWADDEWASRRWADQVWNSRRWAEEDWASRRWAGDLWTSRRWADADWASRRWAQVDWDSRRWAEDDWLAFAWTSRRWASTDWAAAAWDSRAWSSRRWATAEWTDFVFESRRWATEIWTSRRWAVEGWTR